MEIKKFRKKPVVIEAIQLSSDNFDAVCDFIGGTPQMEHNPNYGVDENGNTNESYLGVYIDTLEGTMLAKNGDYIIKGIKGEFYPCKPDIFDATYEPTGEGMNCCCEAEPSAHECEVIENKRLRRDIDTIIQRVKALPWSRERELSVTKLTEAVMWLGMDLKRLNEPNPYPSSKDPSTGDKIEPTADDLKL